MSKKQSVKTRSPFLCDAFEGMKGRRPVSQSEMNEWLVSDEGRRPPYLMTRLFRRGASEGGPNSAYFAWGRDFVAMASFDRSRRAGCGA
jgi:hypothetical protein